jgi:hypothetical protein
MTKLTPNRALAIRVGILLARRTPLGVDLERFPVWRRLSRLERYAYRVHRVDVEYRASEAAISLSEWLHAAYMDRSAFALKLHFMSFPVINQQGAPIVKIVGTGV